MYAAHNFVCKCEVLLVAREEDDGFGPLLLTLRRIRQIFAGPPAPDSPQPGEKRQSASPYCSLDSEFLIRSSSRVIRTVFQLNMQLCNRVE